MARGPRYRVPRRRRREGKTNYYKRYTMIISEKPRFIVRKTLKYVWVQIAIGKPEGDYMIATAHSNELRRKYGWKGNTHNTPAAYLTGLLAALRALRKGVNYAIPDIGLSSPRKGALVFAAIKAANDVGLKVPVSDEVVPSMERIRGDHIATYAKILKENGLLETRFSRYLKNGLDPENLPHHFEEVKNAILKEYGKP